jgi:hypothetical protein
MKKLHLLLIAVFTTLTVPAFGASQLELVTVNTSSLPAATTGYLDFLFNGGGTSFQSATASLTGFATNGTLAASSLSTSGTVMGSLPGTVSMANNNAEYLERITFGSSLTFGLQFSGPAVDAPNGAGSGSTFTLSLLNATQDGAYLTSNLNDGFLLLFNIDGAGRVTYTTYPTSTGAPSVVSITAVPEPSSALLMIPVLATFAGLAFARRPNR